MVPEYLISAILGILMIYFQNNDFQTLFHNSLATHELITLGQMTMQWLFHYNSKVQSQGVKG